MSRGDLPADGVVVSRTTVEADWLDYNDHMNVAFYVLAFDRAIDDIKAVFGIDEAYRRAQGRSTVALEAHITYRNEASLGDLLEVRTRIADCDTKRVHFAQEMYRGPDLLATRESLGISFDLAARRTCPFEPAVLARIEALHAAQAAGPRLAWLGRRVGLHQGRPGG